METPAGEEGRPRRRRQFDPECYRDNGLSKGGRVKEDGEVIQKLVENDHKVPNFRCRIENFGVVVGEFSEVKRKWVAEMGFEKLFALYDKLLPRTLCYWLATRVDVDNEELITVDGKKFPLSPVQVHWVLGIPFGGKFVPNKIMDEAMGREVESIWECFGSVSNCGTRGIAGKNIEKIVRMEVIDEMEFKRAFLMFVLNEVLCPTTCHRFSVKLLPAVTVFASAKEYDWCQLTLDHLFFYLKKFAKSFHNDGYAKGCGGCAIFLAVFYVDKLKRNPVQWGVFPRVKVWTKVAMKKAQADDRLQSGDFGKAGCVDVAYGERHPMGPRDAMPMGFSSDGAVGVISRVSHNFYKKSPQGKRIKRRKDCTLNPFGHKTKVRRDEVFEQGNNVGSHLKGSFVGGADQDNVDGSSVHVGCGKISRGSDECVHVSDAHSVNSLEVQRCINLNVVDGFDVHERSLALIGESGWRYCWSGVANEDSPHCGRSGGDIPIEGPTLGELSDETGDGKCDEEVSYTSLEDDGEADDSSSTPVEGDFPPGFGVPEPCTPSRGQPKDDKEVRGSAVSNEFGQRSRVQRQCRSSMKFMPGYIRDWRPVHCRTNKKKIVQFVRNFQTCDKEHVFIIKADEVGVGVSSLKALLSEEEALPFEYVKVAASMYCKVWGKRYVGRSRKIMMDPQFSADVLGDVDGLADVSRGHAYAMSMLCLKSSPCRINLLVVPVIEGDLWWALAVSMNRSEVIMMDPTGAGLESHETSILKILQGLDNILGFVVPSWVARSIVTWPISKVTYTIPVSRKSSGLMMLMTVKKSADRIRPVIEEGMTFKDREWLLCEDLMCEFNDSRDYARQMIGIK